MVASASPVYRSLSPPPLSFPALPHFLFQNRRHHHKHLPIASFASHVLVFVSLSQQQCMLHALCMLMYMSRSVRVYSCVCVILTLSLSLSLSFQFMYVCCRGVCAHVRGYVCVGMFVWVCLCVRGCSFVYEPVCERAYACVCTCMYVCACVCIAHVCVRRYTHGIRGCIVTIVKCGSVYG